MLTPLIKHLHMCTHKIKSHNLLIYLHIQTIQMKIQIDTEKHPKHAWTYTSPCWYSIEKHEYRQSTASHFTPISLHWLYVWKLYNINLQMSCLCFLVLNHFFRNVFLASCRHPSVYWILDSLFLANWSFFHSSTSAVLGSSIIFLLWPLCAETCLVNGCVLIFSLMMILTVYTPSPSSLLIHPGLKLSLHISANNFVFCLTWSKPYSHITNALWVSSSSFQNKATDVYIITAWRRSLTVIWEFRDWTHAVHRISTLGFLVTTSKLPSGKTSLALLSHISPMYWAEINEDTLTLLNLQVQSFSSVVRHGLYLISFYPHYIITVASLCVLPNPFLLFRLICLSLWDVLAIPSQSV